MITHHPLHFPLQETITMMRPPTNKGFTNDTSSYGLSGSFPHYKHIMMPPDQKAKLLAMHRASRANAGKIYYIFIEQFLFEG